jgi:uncharacterized membrane protein YeaQ/YmgE (transglycosylase-associated protein family)
LSLIAKEAEWMALIGSLIVTIIIVAIVEMISRTNLPYGWLGNIIVGLIGGVLGQYLLGQFGPTLFGVYLVPMFIGSLVLILIAKWIMGQIARSRGEAPAT